MFVSTPTFNVSAYADSTAIVVGSAPCVERDLPAAFDLYPDAEVIGGSSGAIYAFCDHVITKHRMNGETFRNWTRLRWGRESVVHGPEGDGEHTLDHVWHGFKKVSGSSGFAAAVLAASWGFKRVIMAGVPLDNAEGYHPEIDAFLREYPNPHGGAAAAYPGVVWMAANHLMYQRQIIGMQERGLLPRTLSSMSGWTRDFFGGPEDGDRRNRRIDLC